MLGRRGPLYLVALFLLLIAVVGAVMSVAGPQTVKGNMFDGMWWAMVTATTVGYGDLSPVTTVGRLVAVMLMLIGIGVDVTLAASVAAFVVSQDRGGDMAEAAVYLDRIERLLSSRQPQDSD